MNPIRTGMDHKQFVCQVGFDNFFELEKKEGKVPEKSSSRATKFREEGNELYISKFHNKDIHLSILVLYTRSIAYAPPASEALALGYSNRSALLKHLKKYEESIIDIERALQITKSDKLKAKLDSRRKECLSLIGSSASIPKKIELPEDITLLKSHLADTVKLLIEKNLPSCSYLAPDLCDKTNLELPKIKPSKDLPCVADCVELNYDKVYGRKMVANRDIKTGEIVVIEKGFATYPKKRQVYAVCSHCLNFVWNGLPCDACPCAIYCSEKCKKEAWKEYHDIECKVLPFFNCELYEFAELNSIISTLRLFIKVVKAEGLESILNDAKAVDDNKDVCDKKCTSTRNFCYGKFHSLYTMVDYKDVCVSKDDNNYFLSMSLCLLIKYTNIFDSWDAISDSKEGSKLMLCIKNLLVKLKSTYDSNSYGFQLGSCDCCTTFGQCDQNCDKFLGTMLAPISCFFNHSCVENVRRIFLKSGKILLHACLPIKKGEQILASYGPSICETKKERNNFLQKIFYFTCNCKMCAEDWPVRDLNNTFQELYFQEKRVGAIKDIISFIFDKKIKFFSLMNYYKGYFSEESLDHLIQVVEMIYEKYDPIKADALSCRCKVYIEEHLEKLYGLDYEIPNEC